MAGIGNSHFPQVSAGSYAEWVLAANEDLSHAGPFALGTFRTADGAEFAGLLVGDRVRDLSPDSMLDLLSAWDATFPRLTELAKPGAPADPADGPWHDVTALTVLPPVMPGQVFQSGANYRQHVIDLVAAERHSVHGTTPEQARADATTMMDERVAHGTPYVFLGSPRAICGAFDDVILPTHGTQHDWELELAAVIGRPGRHIARADALSHIAGYTICNDITTRDLVHRADLKGIGTDWLAGKNSPTFLPTGPLIVPAAFVDNPMDLRISLRHNGITRQDESTKDMIFDIARLVEYVSTFVELRPGDLLLTGSPAGNGAHWRVFLAPGDVMDAEITGLGRQRNTCVSETPIEPRA